METPSIGRSRRSRNEQKKSKEKKGCPKAAGSQSGQRNETAQKKDCSLGFMIRVQTLFYQASSQASSQKVCGEGKKALRW